MPSLFEYLAIIAFTKRRGWNDNERKMMRTASKSYSIVAGLALLCLLGLGLAGRESFGYLRATSFRDQLMLAETNDVPSLITENERYRKWWQPLFVGRREHEELEPNQRRNVALALLHDDESHLQTIQTEIATATAAELPVLIDSVREYSSEVSHALRTDLDSDDKTTRLNAAAGLSMLGTDFGDDPIAERIANDLITSPLVFSNYLPVFRANSNSLIPWLLEYFEAGSESQRNTAAIAINEYYHPTAQQLADLIEVCTPEQFQTIFPLIEKQRDELLPILASAV